VSPPWKGRREDKLDAEFADLAALADGSLPPERRAALRARVDASPELAERLREQRRAVAFAQSAVDGVEAPAGLRARVEAQRRVRRARVSGRPALIAAAAATALAVAAGVVVFGSGSSGERFHATLSATELQPGAGGEATLVKTSSGWRIELDAPGLPRLAGGRFYEAWLRNGTGVLVPVGTFNVGRKVTLWAGVSPKSFRTLTVTRERADGDQASSGTKVLTGTVDAGG
jgi:Anti-sigma-K factor rskA, C-terminal